MMLKDVVSFSGWNWLNCSFVFPERLMLEMKATPVSFSTQISNRITWSSSPSGNFELKEAYRLARMEADGACNNSFDGEWIWRVSSIPKIKCFLWQCYHKSIPVSSVLVARGMDVLTICRLCNSGTETILHVLRDCQVARNLWIVLSSPLLVVSFFSLQLTNWLRLNCCSTKALASLDITWGIIFAFGIWTLWTHRNEILFRNDRI